MNNLGKICKVLDKGERECRNYCCLGDNYLCAKFMVNQYISKDMGYKDKNRLLLLKSECRDGTFVESYSLLISMISMAICAFTLLFTIVEKLSKNDYSAIWGYGCFLSFILFIYCIILIKSLVKSKAVRKWRPYILTVIEEIEKELE